MSIVNLAITISSPSNKFSFMWSTKSCRVVDGMLIDTYKATAYDELHFECRNRLFLFTYILTLSNISCILILLVSRSSHPPPLQLPRAYYLIY